jgi:hypothetical protein
MIDTLAMFIERAFFAVFIVWWFVTLVLFFYTLS